MIKQISQFISNWLSDIASKETVFNKVKNEFDTALKKRRILYDTDIY